MEPGARDCQGRDVSPVGGAGRGQWNELEKVSQNRIEQKVKLQHDVVQEKDFFFEVSQRLSPTSSGSCYVLSFEVRVVLL